MQRPSRFPEEADNTKGISKSRIAIVIAAVALSIAAILVGFLVYWHMAARTDPSPNSADTYSSSYDESTTSGDTTDADTSGTTVGFPDVDWAYWQGVNPDIIGWITIPGTDVNAPILQAHASDPDRYLSHDVYGNYNPHGAIYLDAECESDGFSSRNAVILGHHFGHDVVAAPFGIIASYPDKEFAADHATILIQTPTSKMTYVVRYAEIVKGWESTKRTSFDSEADYRNWYDSSRDGAAMVLDSGTEPEQTVSLVTCSYNYWTWNERTVVVTSMQQQTEHNNEAET